MSSKLKLSCLQGIDGWEALGQVDWKCAGELIAGHAYRSLTLTEGVLHDHSLLALAQKESDGRPVLFAIADQIIDSGQIELELPCVLGTELRRLQFDDDVATESQMVEQHVEVEVLTCNVQVNLMSNERKTDSQLEQESSDFFDERALQAALLHITTWR